MICSAKTLSKLRLSIDHRKCMAKNVFDSESAAMDTFVPSKYSKINNSKSAIVIKVYKHILILLTHFLPARELAKGYM